MWAAQPLSSKGRALRWLAQREHSRAELERKLRQHLVRQARLADGQAQQAESVDIAALLDELEAKGLLSDARTAESLLAGKGQRLGSHRLKQELQRKGLAAPLVAQTLAKARETEMQRAQELWRRKFGTPAADAAGRARQARFLAGRGFSMELIGRVVRGLDSDE